MDSQEIKQPSYSDNVLGWARFTANMVEDLSQAVLGFVPNGLEKTYDSLLKPFPLLGKAFSNRWIERTFKLCSGMTIAQGLASDIGHYFFKPIGFALGALMGTGALSNGDIPTYKGQIGKFVSRFCGQTVAGALLGVLGFTIIRQFIVFENLDMYKSLFLSAGIGALLGLTAKGMLFIAVNTVHNANAAAARANVQKAKDLNAKLKVAARNKAKSFILMQAQDIIQQVNGAQALQNFEEFLKSEYESIAMNIYRKIDRHFNYLADRACHGDINALKRLQDLQPSRATNCTDAKNTFDKMLERIFNLRAIYKLKDDVDTAYDCWQYQYLRIKTV